MKESLTPADSKHTSRVDTTGAAVSKHLVDVPLNRTGSSPKVKQWPGAARLKIADDKGRKLVSISRSGVPLLSAYIANTCLARLRGLFALPPLAATEALVLQPCSAVHTFGIQQSLDIVYLDKRGEILKQVEMKPGSLSLCWGSNRVIEMTGGTASRLQLQPGQQLDIEFIGGGND